MKCIGGPTGNFEDKRWVAFQKFAAKGEEQENAGARVPKVWRTSTKLFRNLAVSPNMCFCMYVGIANQKPVLDLHA